MYAEYPEMNEENSEYMMRIIKERMEMRRECSWRGISGEEKQ